jgi:hypothetical protein
VIIDEPADGVAASDPDDDIILDRESDDTALSVLVDLDADQREPMPPED